MEGENSLPPFFGSVTFQLDQPLTSAPLQLRTAVAGGGREKQPGWSRGRTEARCALPGAAQARVRLAWPQLRTLSFQGGKFQFCYENTDPIQYCYNNDYQDRGLSRETHEEKISSYWLYQLPQTTIDQF